MITATEPTIVPPVTMLENLMTGLAAISDANDVEVLQSGIRDMIDEAARYQAMLMQPGQTGSNEAQGVASSADTIERILQMVASTHTTTGMVLKALDRAGVLDDVARGASKAGRGIVKLVKRNKAQKVTKAKAKARPTLRKVAAKKR
jgi:hypothetical protein